MTSQLIATTPTKTQARLIESLGFATDGLEGKALLAHMAEWGFSAAEIEDDDYMEPLPVMIAPEGPVAALVYVEPATFTLTSMLLGPDGKASVIREVPSADGTDQLKLVADAMRTSAALTESVSGWIENNLYLGIG